MADQKHQKAVIASLLIAPSTLHKAFREKNDTDFNKELDRLNLSPLAKQAARDAKTAIDAKQKRTHFEEGAKFLKSDLWKGQEPHPTDEEALALAKEAKRLDGEA